LNLGRVGRALLCALLFACAPEAPYPRFYPMPNGVRVVEDPAKLPHFAANEHARVDVAGIWFSSDPARPESALVSWHFVLTVTSDAIGHVDIYDVTGERVRLVSDTTYGRADRTWEWKTEGVPISRATTPWLLEAGDTYRTFEFVLGLTSGGEAVLQQCAFFSEATKMLYREAWSADAR
jgi:hypothetical protein